MGPQKFNFDCHSVDDYHATSHILIVKKNSYDHFHGIKADTKDKTIYIFYIWSIRMFDNQEMGNCLEDELPCYLKENRVLGNMFDNQEVGHCLKYEIPCYLKEKKSFG